MSTSSGPTWGIFALPKLACPGASIFPAFTTLSLRYSLRLEDNLDGLLTRCYQIKPLLVRRQGEFDLNLDRCRRHKRCRLEGFDAVGITVVLAASRMGSIGRGNPVESEKETDTEWLGNAVLYALTQSVTGQCLQKTCDAAPHHRLIHERICNLASSSVARSVCSANICIPVAADSKSPGGP
jgi:hypothetical protein